MIRSTVLVFMLLLCFGEVGAGFKESRNPTKLWELRDSLQILTHDSVYAEEASKLLEEVPALNKFLSKVTQIIPFANLRIDVIQSSCPARAVHLDAIRKRLAKHGYQRIAVNCAGIRTINTYVEQHQGSGIISVGHPLLTEFVRNHVDEADDRMCYIVRLCKMVQCEVALISLGFSLRENRDLYGGPNTATKGLLVIDDYYEQEHLKKILRLVGAKTNID
jgi:hypothetical protein